MSPRMSEKELLERLADLPREIKPGRDPWTNISAAIEQPAAGEVAAKRATPWWFSAAAAAVVLAFAAGLLLDPLFEEGMPSQEQLASSDPVPAINTGEVVANTRVPGLLHSVDAEYAAAFREFIGAGESRDALAAQTVEKIEMGWADLRGTEEALTVALEENPGDLFLSERMMELRARQLGFLKQLVSLERNNRRLTI